MAYMHKTTFRLYSEVSTAVPNDYIFIDDLIALPVQILNRRGYPTTACCSDHPFYTEEHDAGTAEFRTHCQSYIAFHEGVIALPELPEGFYTEVSERCLSIRRDYRSNGYDAYGMFAAITESMKQLYEWTLTLPEYADFLKEYIKRRRENS